MDATGQTVSVTGSINVIAVPTNEAPVILSTPPANAYAGQQYRYQLVFEDPEGDEVRVLQPKSESSAGIFGPIQMDDNYLFTWTPTSEGYYFIKARGGVTSLVIELQDAQGNITTHDWPVNYLLPESENTDDPFSISLIPSIRMGLNSSLFYQVQVTPNHDDLQYSITGPDSLNISDTGLIGWQPSIAFIGSHDITVTVTNGSASSSTRFTIEVIESSVTGGNASPTITSTPVFNGYTNVEYRYAVQATDPDDDAIQYTLNQSPTGMTINNNGRISWIPSEEQIGTHPVEVQASDGQTSTTQSYTLTITDTIPVIINTISITPDPINLGDTVTVSISTSGGVSTLTSTLTLNGIDQALGDNDAFTWIANNNGLQRVQVSTTDGVSTEITEFSFSVFDPSDTTPPVVSITAPEFDTLITEPTALMGSVTDEHLAYYRILILSPGSTEFVEVARNTEPVENNRLATIDPSQFINGIYQVLVEAVDENNQTTQETITVIFDGDLKVGNFSITLEDLNIPMAGIPIRVTRTYDSRRRHELLAFGYGWSIDYQNVKVEESRVPGTFWRLNEYPTGPLGILRNYCIEPNGAPVVTVTLPSGAVERFEVEASNRCQVGVPMFDTVFAFKPTGDTESTLVATDQSGGRLINGEILDLSNGEPLNPNHYVLTTAAGYEYHLDQTLGIERVIDPNGNTLTYTEAGITHSSGKSVDFIRDAAGRITQIVDPAGHTIQYAYHSNNDLLSVTERDAAITTYSYYGRNCTTATATADCHLLKDILDPLGRRLVKNIYDDSGRLIAQEDQAGNRTEFNHDVSGRQSIVTDRNGNTSIYAYDARGNVLTQVDTLGHTQTFSYDANDNQLTQTDALGNVTRATYNATNDQLTQTDALGNTISYTYNVTVHSPSVFSVQMVTTLYFSTRSGA